MRIVSAKDRIDIDGAFTLLLTILVTLAGLGIPPLIAFFFVLRKASVETVQQAKGYSHLVFGKQLVDGRPDSDFRLRLERAANFIRKQPITPTLLLGGQGLNNQMSEAAEGLAYLHQLGIDNDANIILEEGSRNTLENLRNAREILRSINSPGSLLITSRYHLARCEVIASSLGIANLPCPAEDRLSISPSNLFRLMLESHWILWFVIGKKWARLTNNQRMLKRVT